MSRGDDSGRGFGTRGSALSLVTQHDVDLVHHATKKFLDIAQSGIQTLSLYKD